MVGQSIQQEKNVERLVKEKFSQEELESYQRTFAIFDKDGNGYVSKTEIGGMLVGLGEYPTSAELDKILGTVDADGDGMVSFYDFVLWAESQERGVRNKSGAKEEDEEMAELRTAFMMCNVSNTGYITVADLTYVFKCIGEEQSEEDLVNLIAEADTDNDGRISFDEFVQCLKGEEQNGCKV